MRLLARESPTVTDRLGRLPRHAGSGPRRREGLARDVLHDRDGALDHERDRIGVGAHAVARGPGRGAGGVEESRCRRRRAVWFQPAARMRRFFCFFLKAARLRAVFLRFFTRMAVSYRLGELGSVLGDVRRS